MKRLGKVLLSILLIVPMFVGMCFLSPNLTPTPNGGGGANSLNSPKTGESSDIKEENDAEPQQCLDNPVFKTYEDFYVDFFNLPSESYSVADGVVTIDYSSITRHASGSKISLKHNGDVFDIVTEQDLVGDGSSENPFVVHSTKGFLYLINRSLSNYVLNSKYMELACNIVLNEETFCDDGGIKNGDGIVYNFRRIYNCTNLIFDGKGFEIRGLYFNDETSYNGGLFYAEGAGVASISNLSLDNFWVYGAGALYMLGKNVKSIENCHIKNGEIRGKNDNVSAFSYYSESILNCTNYANVSGRYYVSAFSIYLVGNIQNCINYGNITGSFEVSGFVVYVQGNLTIKNCINYGDIVGVVGGDTLGTTIAGIVAVASVLSEGESCQIISCKNYGKIMSPGQSGAIIAYASGSFLVFDCHNYGEVGLGEYGCGAFIGRIATDTGCQTTKAEIFGCSSISSLGAPFIGVISREKVQTTDNLIIIKNSFLTASHALTKNGIVAYVVGSGFELQIENLELFFEREHNSCYLVNHIQENAKLFVKNIIAFNNSNKETIAIYNWNNGKIEMHSFVIVNKRTTSYFYGRDFSGFYINYKSGKIYLVALNAKGFYQKKATEEDLIRKGFVKKSI